MNEENAKGFSIIGNILGKLFLVGMAGLVFLIVTLKLVFDPTWPAALAELVLGPTVFLVYRHFFSKPAKI